ncbi:MAG: glyoxalase/bleomycin resistance protein/dioxygenase [Rubritepida sp.]|nr:glyoxalase/bleomycin resistance protein/dioxygenase [Rubritepida sp.]
MTTEGPPAGGFAPLVPELDVEDIAVSLDFWCATLGFRIAYSRPERGFAFLEREGAQVMLCRRNGSWEVGPLDRPFGRGINFQIEVKAAGPILAALAARDWPLFRPTEDSWYRMAGEEVGCREFLVQDPDGYLLRFSESLGRRPAQNAV